MKTKPRAMKPAVLEEIEHLMNLNVTTILIRCEEGMTLSRREGLWTAALNRERLSLWYCREIADGYRRR